MNALHSFDNMDMLYEFQVASYVSVIQHLYSSP